MRRIIQNFRFKMARPETAGIQLTFQAVHRGIGTKKAKYTGTLKRQLGRSEVS